ncbi:MAG: hypothetical protein C4583_00710 [Anaerolineaceae bacterium]|nr:MAG: hypothetical protein C4583_00710 [Anaerolineaceae bacterium]
MKKIVSLVVVMFMIVALFSACGQGDTTDSKAATNETSSQTSNDSKDTSTDKEKSDSGKESLADQIFKGIEPLAKPTDLNFGLLSDSQHGFVCYFIDQIGGYDKVGITPKFNIFGNGPVMVEAVSSNGWDCGTYGVGGTLAGSVGYGALVLGAATRDNCIWIFASNDSDIVKAGKVTKDSPELYGTAEAWKGTEVYLPTGTTMHYALAKGLDKLGLTTNDVKMTHMDVPSVNTALLAGKGEAGGLWSNFVFSKKINEKYTPVIKAADVGANMITVLTANAKSYADEVKRAAIDKWVEMYYAVIDWLYDDNGTLNQENLSFFVEKYLEWDEANGIMATPEDIISMIKESPYFTLEETYDTFNKTVDTEDGKMSELEFMDYDVLKFFISCGNYKPDSVGKLLNKTHIPDVVNKLYDLKHK